MMSEGIETPDKINKDSMARLISMFEVKRPRKAPNSTLRKTKSISSLLTAISSDEEETKSNKSTCCPLTKDKNKRRTKSTKITSQQDYLQSNIKNALEDLEQINKTVEDFGLKLKERRQKKSESQIENAYYLNIRDLPRTFKIYSYEEADKNSNCANETANEFKNCVQSLDRRFFKKDVNRSSSIYDTPCKELISRRRVKDKNERVQTFTGMTSEIEIESYRMKLVNELDSTLKELKIDGFIDGEENSSFEVISNNKFTFLDEMEKQLETEGKPTWAQRVRIRRASNQDLDLEGYTNIEDEVFDDTIIVDNTETENDEIGNENTNKRTTRFDRGNITDDEFGESLAEDLEENGSYFVEAYNDEGKELVIVEITVERRAVDLSSLDTIAESIKNSDIVFHQNDDRSLNMIDNPTEFVSAESISSGFMTNSESNRSTVYSNASRYSEVFDTDDEGIHLGNGQKHDDEDYNNYRRETFCDDRGIVRIERIGYTEHPDDGTGGPVSRNDSFAQKGTLSYIIDEIKTTERKYVEDLSRVVAKYIPYIEEHTPPNLIGRQCYIFGNIEKLYHKQRGFLMALESCGDTVEEVVKTFLDFENLFKLYPRYFKNKPKADIVVKEFSDIIKDSQIKFEERLDLSAYLLTPLQRLGKYKLFLENIEKQLKKMDLAIDRVQMALDIIKREMSKGNDFVAIESIENSPINKEDYGSFKMREKFNILKPRRIEAMVFLFENIIVFTICDPRNMDTNYYFNSIKMTDLRIATFEDLTLHLTDYTKSKRMSRADRFTYVLEAKTSKIRETWRTAIEAILWQQLLTVKENTLKMYQSSKASRKVKGPRKLVRSTGASKFYVE